MIYTFDIMNRSEERSRGSSTLYFIVRKNKTAKISAQLDADVGCLQFKKYHNFHLVALADIKFNIAFAKSTFLYAFHEYKYQNILND